MALGMAAMMLGGAALGALGSSGGGGSQTTTSEPWAAQQPYLRDLFGQAQTQFNQGGSPLVGGAQDYAMGMMQGDYLNSNPYLDKMFNRASSAVSRQYQDTIAPGIAGNAVLGGRYGSPAYARQQEGGQRALGETLGNMATDIYGGNYARERGFQQQTLGMAPQIANMPWQNLQNYGSLVGGNYGGTTTTPYSGGNMLAGAAGGAMLGMGMYGGGGFGSPSGGGKPSLWNPSRNPNQPYI